MIGIPIKARCVDEFCADRQIVQRPKSDMRMIFFIVVEFEVIYRVINFQGEWG